MTHTKQSILALLERAHQEHAKKEVIERLRWFAHFVENGSVSKTCTEFSIARTTFYRWYNRLDAKNLSTLENVPKSGLLKDGPHGNHNCLLCSLNRILGDWRQKLTHKPTAFFALVTAVINISIFFLIALPQVVGAASSWAPTLIVNTEAFQVIDDTDSAADLYLQFGGTLNKRLTYDRTLALFIFNDDLEVIGTVSGSTIHAQDRLQSSGSLIVDGASVFLNGLDCSGNDNGGALTVGADGQVSCSDDDSGAGGGGAFSGTGSLQDFFDNRYVHVEGDTMTGALTIFKDAGTATGNTLVVDTDGLVFDASERRVGIGTDTPDYTLDIQSGSTTTMRFRNDNGSGAVFRRSTASNTLTLENTITQPASDTTSAVSFNGSPDYVDIGSDSSLYPSYMSISAWSNSNNLSGQQAIIANDSVHSANTGFSMYRYNSVMYFDVGVGTGYGRTSYAYSDLNTWVHWLGTYDGTTVRLYKNGSEVSTAAISGTMSAPTTKGTEIGRHPSFTTYVFSGEIDDARIYDRALDTSEISEIYNSGSGTPDDVSAGGLVGWWKFDENTGTSAADSSDNSNTGTLSGAGWATGKIAGATSIQTATIISSIDGALEGEKGIVKFGEATGNTQLQGQELGFYTGGTQRIMVDSGGLVGVKTTTPTEELEVVGTISGSTIHAQDNLSTSGSLAIESSIFGAGLADCDTSGTDKLLWDATTGTFSCGSDNTGGGSTGTGSLQNFFDNRYIEVGGDTMTGALIINPTTATAEGDLEVVGLISGTTLHFGDLLTGSGYAVFRNVTDSTTSFQINDADGGNPVLNVDTTNERVGIGTDSPETNLHIYDATGPATLTIESLGESDALGQFLNFERINTGPDSFINFFTGGANIWSLGADGDGTNHFRFQDSGVNVVTIEDGGAADSLYIRNNGGGAGIGMGTSTPTEKLEVVGTISGTTLHATDSLTSSGTLVFEGAASGASLYVADGFAGSGLADCDTAGTSKLLWDVTTERFSCGTDTDTTIADTNTNQLTTFSLTGDSGTPETIAQGNTLDIAGGAEITTAVSATDTITINITDNTVDFAELQDTLDLDASTTLNFGGSNFIYDLTSTGDFMIRDNGSAAFFVDDSGRIGIGTEDLVSNIELDVAANDTLVDLYLKRIDSTISNGTGLGFIRFAGTDGGSESSPLIGAGIQGQAAGTWATGNSPANLIFWTTPDSSSTLTERMRIRPDGKVGIGTATPTAKFDVIAVEYQTGAYLYSSGATVLALDNYSGTTGSGMNAHIMFGYRNVFDTELYRHGNTGSGGIVIKTQQTSTSDNAFRIITQNGSANNTVFKVRADGAVTAEGSFTGGGADLAEWFPTADPGMTPGDITCLDPKRPKHVKRCNSRELKMIGIYSTNPGFIGNSQMGMEGPSALIGLIGQVPVKVIGNVDIGDSITLSKTDSVGKRAGPYDPSICIAMEEHRGGEIGTVTCLLTRNTGSSGSAPIDSKSVADYLLKSFKDSMRLDDF